MDIGSMLPLWSIIPFAGMLLCVAILPVVKAEWWEAHQLQVALAWSALFIVPFAAVFGLEIAGEQLAEVLLLDYVPFIVLLLGLFTVAGDIHVKGTIVGTTRNNVILLLIGTLLASWVGTTGAAMLLIRSVLRANSWRKHKSHIVIFFIFLVANIGGCLTPLGDPPLFLGFLRGIPFFWTAAHIWPLLILNTVLLLVVFVLLDRHFVKKEGKEGLEAMKLMDQADRRTPIRIEGWHNIFFIALIVVAVILNGAIPQMEFFATGAGAGWAISLFHGKVVLTFAYFVQIALILVAMAGSWLTTPKKIRRANDFEWGPIAEVAKLFLGIFITMIPALAILRTSGGSLGVDTPLEFFWATGALSSFLDNSPTFVVFLTTAGALGSDAAAAVATTVGMVDPSILLAISAGAVFMGAVTYIGNAPNFMVKNMAEKARVKMPSFFGYMVWSIAILVPVFIIDTLLFFL